MEVVKTEAANQSTDSASISIVKMYKEMNEKYGKMQQEFVESRKEIAELRRENVKIKREMAKLKNEMVMKNAKFQQQITKMNEELLAKFRDQNQREDLEKQQSPTSMMDNSQHSNNFDDLPNKRVQNEFAETLTMDELNQLEQQNLDNTFDCMEKAEMRTNCPFQMPTTSSSLNLNNKEEGGNKQNELHELIVEKIEWGESGDPSFEMDLDEEEENGTSQNVKTDDTGRQIKSAPIIIDKILKCNWPGCEFQSLYYKNMHIHRRVHTGERPSYVCAECGQLFTYQTSLKRHLLIHTGDKPYKCEMCDKSFRHNSALVRHKRTHEMPFVCEECGQSFSMAKTLRTHVLFHKGEKPYQCDVCGQSFRQSNNLVGHKRIHTGERPYVCEQCGQSFKRSDQLNDHKRTHTNERPYLCMECGKSFKSSPELRKHTKRHRAKHIGNNEQV